MLLSWITGDVIPRRLHSLIHRIHSNAVDCYSEESDNRCNILQSAYSPISEVVKFYWRFATGPLTQTLQPQPLGQTYAWPQSRSLGLGLQLMTLVLSTRDQSFPVSKVPQLKALLYVMEMVGWLWCHRRRCLIRWMGLNILVCFSSCSEPNSFNQKLQKKKRNHCSSARNI